MADSVHLDKKKLMDRLETQSFYKDVIDSIKDIIEDSPQYKRTDWTISPK
jgi:hypothetical protein